MRRAAERERRRETGCLKLKNTMPSMQEARLNRISVEKAEAQRYVMPMKRTDGVQGLLADVERSDGRCDP